MNVYINYKDNKAYYIHPGTCTWTQLDANDEKVETQVETLINDYFAENVPGIDKILDGDSVVLHHTNTGSTAMLESMKDSEIPNLFNE